VVKSDFAEKLTRLAEMRTEMREFSERLPGMLPSLDEEKERAINVIRNRLSVLRDCVTSRKASMLAECAKSEGEHVGVLQLEMIRLKRDVASLTARRDKINEAIDERSMYEFYETKHPAAKLQLSPPVPALKPLRDFSELEQNHARVLSMVRNDEQILYLSQMKANIASGEQANFKVGQAVVVEYEGEYYDGTVADAEYRIDEFGDAVFHYLVWFNSFRLPDWVHGSLIYNKDDAVLVGKTSPTSPPPDSLQERLQDYFKHGADWVTGTGTSGPGPVTRETTTAGAASPPPDPETAAPVLPANPSVTDHDHE